MIFVGLERLLLLLLCVKFLLVGGNSGKIVSSL